MNITPQPCHPRTFRMKSELFRACMLATIAAASAAASAQPTLTEAQARAAIAPLYATFTQPVKGDVKTLLDGATTDDWQSCSGDSPKECRGRDVSIRVFEGFGKAIPDMKHEIREVIVAGDKVIVRGELSGTPAGDFFGVPHTGRSFKIMALDIQTVKDGKIAKTYHLEDWAAAISQLKSK
ncbi:MAG: ester cyclase [Ideonella sp.]